MCKFYKWELSLQLAFVVLESFLLFLKPYFLNKLLGKLQEGKLDSEGKYYLILYLSGMVFSEVAHSIVSQKLYWTGRRVGTGVRAVLASEVYTKLLSKKDSSVAKQAEENTQEVEADDSKKEPENDESGLVTNLLNSDTITAGEAISYLHMMFGYPLQLVFALLMLWDLLGYSVLFGIAVMLVANTALAYVSSWYTVLYEKVTKAGDARISIINEVCTGFF